MKIKYLGRHLYDREYHSTYFVGNLSFEKFREFRDIFSPDYYSHQNEGLFHHLIVKKYLKTEHTMLYNWLEQCKIPFGGNVLVDFGEVEMFLLLRPESQEELAFRLCFEIKVETV